MRTDTRRLRAYILFLGDAALLYGALILTLAIRYREFDPEVVNTHLAAFTPLFAVFLTIFYAARLYDLVGAQSITALLLQALSPMLIGLAAAVGYFYFLGAGLPGTISPRTNLALFFAIFAALFFAWHRFGHRLFGKALVVRAVAIGDKPETDKLAGFLREHPEYGYRIVYAAENEWDLELLRKLIRENGVTAVIAAPHSVKAFAPHLTELIELNVDFWDLASFYETRLERIALSLVEETWFLENIIRRESKVSALVKTATDRILAGAILILTLPFWPLIAFAVKLTSDGPAFYTQTRIGYGGKPFTLLKFRTMRRDAEKQGPKWADTNDPRVTPAGRILRKLQLDELPQLWNIVKGEMSFVGPRPERPEFAEELRKLIPFYDLRHLVRPGLTGWAQLNFRYGASVEDAREKLEYDLYYVKNRSLALDFAIVLKTLNVILRGGTGR